MANIIVEYKMDKNQEGAKVRPYLIDDGGYWYNPNNYTYIGIVGDPEVKIPETVIRFTKTTFRNRLLAIHDSEDENGNSLALTKLDETSDQPYHDRIELTEEEVRQMSDDWWTNNV